MKPETEESSKRKDRLIDLEWHRFKKQLERDGFQAQRDDSGRHTVLFRFPGKSPGY